MSVLERLRPENGPVGAAFGTWLDFAPSGLSTRFFLLWFVILYTAFQVLSFASLGLHPESLTVYAFGLHPAAGYQDQPPLAALMAAAWFALFPPTDWAFHLLAMGNAALGLFAIDRIAARYLQGDKRILVLLLLLLTPFYQFRAQRFAADQTLLSTWPIATYCFVRAFETRALAWAAAAGAAAALTLVGNYYSIFLIAGFVAAIAAAPARRSYLLSPSPWLSAVAGIVALAPHVQWLYANHYAPLAHAIALHTGQPLGEVLVHDAAYLLGGAGYVAVLLAIYALVVRPDAATLRETLWPRDPEGRMLIVLLAVPLLLPALIAPFVGAALSSVWTAPGWFLLPIMLLRPAAAEVTRVAAIRITALVVAITLGALIAAPFIARRRLTDGGQEGREFYRQIAGEVTNNWHLATGGPIRIVMGDAGLAAATTFYSPDHPDSVPNFDLKATPWVTDRQLDSEGFVAICGADDQPCSDEARRRSANRNDLQFITFSTLSRYLSNTGRLGRFLFILIPPNRGTRIFPR